MLNFNVNNDISDRYLEKVMTFDEMNNMDYELTYITLNIKIFNT